MPTINFSVPEAEENLKPKITVIGVGGAGGNAVNNMIASELEGCDFVVANTDSQALNQSKSSRKLQLGRQITQGLGAGARPDAGSAAAEESIEEIQAQLEGSHMVFITAGMGGGTGTGAAPVIARAAKEAGILTVGVVTKPFHFEGTRRMRTAEQGIEQLQQYVDTLIIIPNQNLFRVANEKTTFADAFQMADDVLRNGVRSITDLMMVPGLVNLDFADIRTVMSEMGKAMMGTGEASGEKRALEAAEAAIANPLLEDASMKGARAVLINITGGMDMALYEVDEAANRIREEVDPEANIIFGSTFDPTIEGGLRVSVVATGIDAEEVRRPKPTTIPLTNARSDKPAAAKPAPGFGTHAPAPQQQPAAAEHAPAAAAFSGQDDYAGGSSVEDMPSERFAATGNAQQPGLSNPAGEPAQTGSIELGQTVLKPNPALRQAPRAQQPQQSTPRQHVADDNGDMPFIPPRAARPTDNAPARGEPDVYDAADTGHSSRPRFGGIRNLFGKNNHQTEQDAAPRQQAAAPQAQAPAPRQTELSLGDDARPQLKADPASRVKTSSASDDLLEIPAFLRRQAN
ncbi:cell division protein FtsZ [Thalassospira profundimaris]|uniref:Cell division protein FtsZ n=1 Tax=Thalassospira profundimaris TaxID=502049 RepID=A0A367XAV0_9PROT|nr:cell division protein FtsZ [Thalassospira profundimaris]RCK49901.1 cell division protein FtsZ [Thalassospira profundimaris]